MTIAATCALALGSACDPRAAKPAGGAADGEAVPQHCVSAGGFEVCGGATSCPEDPACKCDPGFCEAGADLCLNAAALAVPLGTGFLCPDGDVLVLELSLCGLDAAALDLGDCYPYEVGALFAQNGAADQVRYADYSLWTGDPLPDPVTCPTFGTFRICGADCGGCNNGEVCTGRSPVHPYGTCIATNAPPCSTQGTTPCEVGSSCFRYTVQPVAQPGANRYGVCLPTAECQDLAANLPGGGTCQ